MKTSIKKEIINSIGDFWKYNNFNNNFVFWKIGTNINKILQIFLTKVAFYRRNNDLNSSKLIEILNNKFDKNSYALCFKDEEDHFITPNDNFKTQYVSKSSITQYIRILEAFGFIHFIGKNSSKSQSEELMKGYYLIDDMVLIYLDEYDELMANAKRKIFLKSQNNEKYPQEIVFSIFISYVGMQVLDEDEELNNIPTSKSKKVRETMTSEEISNEAKKSGYDNFVNWVSDNDWNLLNSIEKYKWKVMKGYERKVWS